MTAADQSPLAPLLETLEDPSASVGEQTDAYLTLTSRMTGEDGKEIIAEIEKKLPQLFKVLETHIASQNSELSSAALQALGFCLYNPKIASGLSEINIQELLSKLNDIVKSSDKNVRTRALWVISKQTFPTEVVGKVVSSIIDSLEIVFNRGEMHSAVVDYEALNVIIRQEYWSGLPSPLPGDLPDLGMEPGSPALRADSLPSKPPGNPVSGI